MTFYLFSSCDRANEGEIVSDSQSVTFDLNGKTVTVEAQDELPLLYALRDILGLKATRFGCGDAACGACMVIVDGKAKTSCDLPISAVAGARVETAESLDTDPAHPLVSAFLARQAGQCGYCLTGILMAAKALLDSGTGDPIPRSEIAAALDDNLCRCGSHARILGAIEEASRKMAGSRS